MTFFQSFAEATWSILLELAPWLLLGAAVAGLLHVLVPSHWIQKKFSGVPGVLRAVIFGVPLPLCSCGVIPAGLGLKKDGASDGSTVAFLTATPQTGVDSVLVSASFLGWPFALFKVGAALVTGVIGGIATELWGEQTDRAAEEDDAEIDAHLVHPTAGGNGGVVSGIRDAFDHMVEVLASIWGWLVFGILVAALITTVAPASGWSVLQNVGIWPAMLLVLAISTPLYVCATASVPIAAALVAAGMPTGAALVFLMAGPASNVATIGAIYRTLGRRNLIVYFANVVLGSLLLGWLFQGVIDPGAVSDIVHGAHDHATWWRMVLAVALVGFFVYFAVMDARQKLAERELRTSQAMSDSIVVEVSGMTCGGCVNRLTRDLESLDGVDKAVVSLEPGRATIVGAASRDDVVTAVREAGFRAT